MLPNAIFEAYQLKQWTVHLYHRLYELGLLNDSERTELIAGHITLMTAKETPHVTALRLLSTQLQLDALLLDRPFFVSTQDPIQLDQLSEPAPDLAIVKGAILDYADRHPQPSDVLLVVEIADSTLQQDCEVKDKLYARAGIVEYWVLDLQNRRLHIFQEPTVGGYERHLVFSEPCKASPIAVGDIVLSLKSILPPIRENLDRPD